MKRLFLMLALLSLALAASAAEVPMKPFEPVEWGPPLTGAELRLQGVTPLAGRGLPNDPFLVKQYNWCNQGQPDDKGQVGLAGCDIRLFDAWPLYQPKQEIILAIVDSGLDLTHEDVDPAILWTNAGETGLDAQGRDKATNGIDDDGNGYVDDVHGWNFVRNSNDVQEDHYHGTHVGGLLCAKVNNGVGITGGFPGLKIMLVKIFGLGQTLSSEQIAVAVHYAVDNGAKVLSNSYGTPSFTEAMQGAVKYAHDKGALFVCASGNSRKNMDSEEDKDYPSCYGFDNQLVVAATDNRDFSTFSNYGSMVDIAAPGENIFSLWPKSMYRSLSGTSQACPIAAAAAAWVWAMHPDYAYADVKAHLLRTADQIPGLSLWARGGLRLNLFNALANKPGTRLPVFDYSTWRDEARMIESAHPYPNLATGTWDVVATGAKQLRFHFVHFGISHYGDTLTIEDRNGRPLQYFNDVRDDIWTDPIATDAVRLILSANEFTNDFGFKIDRVQWLP